MQDANCSLSLSLSLSPPDETFGCAGDIFAVKYSAQQCCDDGFLAYRATFDEGCTVCSGKL